MLSVGDKAPDFKVQDHTGRTVTLSQFEGQTVVLWFYPRRIPRDVPRKVVRFGIANPNSLPKKC